MEGITDIHSHILFSVDDGSDSIGTSIKILKKEYEQGVRNVILTPHYHVGECMPKISVINENFHKLEKKAAEVLPDISLYLGSEIMVCNDMVRLLDNGKLSTLAESRYVLIEFYPAVQYVEMEKRVSLLLNNGYIPIIAHCERYQCLRSRFKVINEKNINHLTEMGAYIQVNAISVYEKYTKFVSKLIEKDLLHFIATDAHNYGKRGVYWDKCIKYLEKKYNDDYLKWLLIDNPKKILEGQYI